jgi:hypothetical protein
VTVAGRVEKDGAPVAATVTFSGQDRQGTVTVASDEEGHLWTVLPGPGTYDLYARQSGSAATVALPSIQVSPGSNEVTIEVEDTLLRGRVVDPAGAPLPPLQVVADRRGGAPRGVSRTPVDPSSGEFHFAGLPGGRYQVQLGDRAYSAEPVGVDLRAGHPSPEVVLVLEGPARVPVQVSGPAGPVAGALVYLLPRFATWRRAGVETGVTGADGIYEARLPAGASEVEALVLAPGHALRSLALPFDPHHGIEITVSTVGGTLVVDGGETAAAPSWSAGGGQVFLDGRELWPHALARWHQLHGAPRMDAGRRMLPAMEPGHYRFCATPPGPCRGGDLLPGGQLVLKVPADRR